MFLACKIYKIYIYVCILNLVKQDKMMVTHAYQMDLKVSTILLLFFFHFLLYQYLVECTNSTKYAKVLIRNIDQNNNKFIIDNSNVKKKKC